jgi:hypothetical protein
MEMIYFMPSTRGTDIGSYRDIYLSFSLSLLQILLTLCFTSSLATFTIFTLILHTLILYL